MALVGQHGSGVGQGGSAKARPLLLLELMLLLLLLLEQLHQLWRGAAPVHAALAAAAEPAAAAVAAALVDQGPIADAAAHALEGRGGSMGSLLLLMMMIRACDCLVVLTLLQARDHHSLVHEPCHLALLVPHRCSIIAAACIRSLGLWLTPLAHCAWWGKGVAFFGGLCRDGVARAFNSTRIRLLI